MTDVAIIGAGPAGSATALALVQAGIDRVVLIDQPKSRPFSIGESCAPDVVAKMQQLGFDVELGQQGHTPYHANVSCWGGVHHTDDFLHRLAGQGWHLDRQRFDRQLMQKAIEQGAELIQPAKVSAIKAGDSGWQLQLKQGGQASMLNCRYLVDASGRSNAVTKHLKVKRERLDNLMALAWTLPDGSALRGRTLVESMPCGWWYATCLPDGKALISLMSDADLTHSMKDPQCLRQWWQQSPQLSHWLPVTDQIDIQPTAFAAHAGFIKQAAGPGWIAVGDALAAFDPLTSSGISNAFGDALAAREVILAWLAKGDLAPAQTYAERMNRSIKRYMSEWWQQYQREQRWPEQLFWQRRQLAQ
jgi:flavin-dependent dehydrogenase